MAPGSQGRWLLVGCIAGTLLLALVPPASSTPAAPEWRAHAFPDFAAKGCIKTAWLDGSIYGVRTPACSLATGQDITLERYDPATGETTVLAHLPEAAVQATVKEIAGRLYVFTPQHVGLEPVPVHVFEPRSQLLSVRATSL